MTNVTEVFSPDGEGTRLIEGQFHDSDELLRARQRDARHNAEAKREHPEPTPTIVETKKGD